MTMVMVTPPTPEHPAPRFGIGAIPIRGITLRYPNARFRGNKLFSNPRAFQGDRQYLPTRDPEVRPIPSIDPNTDLSP
jgi:hypothetical protein